MKKILITGNNSYVGISLVKWLGNYPDEYSIDTISLRNDTWKKKDFTKYDVVFHVAGIAHIKETKENADFYYKVNRDLAYETAQKAKNDGIKQFIFLSSMSVYGKENGIIDKTTPLKPNSNYGKSKLQAEQMINRLESDSFKIAILRPPMIYGKGCKGNYSRLGKLAKKSPIFPDIQNERSMIYIDNFCEFVRLLISDYGSGIFFPQNEEYVCSSEMVRTISKVHGKNIWMTKLFNPILTFNNVGLVNKVFGNLVYEKKMSSYNKDYNIKNLLESLRETESRN